VIFQNSVPHDIKKKLFFLHFLHLSFLGVVQFFLKQQIYFKSRRAIALESPWRKNSFPSTIKILLGCRKGDMHLVSEATCALVRRRILAMKGSSRRKAGSGSRFSCAFGSGWHGMSVWLALWAQGQCCHGGAAVGRCRKEQELGKRQLRRLSHPFWAAKRKNLLGW